MSRHDHHHQIHYLETLKGIATMLRDPGATQSVFDIEDGLRDIEAAQLFLQYVRRDPAMAGLIEQRYLRHEPHDLPNLLKLPEGSLGYCFAHHIEDHGFDPEYFRKIEVKDDLDYVMMRMRQTHDIWHVVTGFATDPIGEVGLKAFELAQTRRPMSAVIACGGVLRFLLQEPEDLGNLLAAVAEGYRKGVQSGLLLAQKWEEHWERPLAEWRTMLNLTPVGAAATAP